MYVTSRNKGADNAPYYCTSTSMLYSIYHLELDKWHSKLLCYNKKFFNTCSIMADIGKLCTSMEGIVLPNAQPKCKWTLDKSVSDPDPHRHQLR